MNFSKLNKKNLILGAGILCLFVWSFSVFQSLTTKDYTVEEVPVMDDLPRNSYDFSLLQSHNGILSYEDDQYTSRYGIDVSTHQKDIDWQQVANSGVEFVFIRLGYRGYESGELHVDAQFEQNYAGAKAVGLDIGVYFFSQAISDVEAMDEAYFVRDQLYGKTLDFPVVYDLEEVAGEVDRVEALDQLQRTNNALAFCGKIEELGYPAMVYTNLDWATNTYQLSQIMNYPIWMAHYATSPGFEYEFQIWQYSSTGRVPGIVGDVDLNLMFIPKGGS